MRLPLVISLSLALGGCSCGSAAPPNPPPGGTTCLPAPAAGSIAEDCASKHRTCVEPTSGAASCSACAGGFVEVAGACEATKTCAELSCAADHRACSDAPNGHCTDCLPGMIEDSPGGACRAPKTCADIQCMLGSSCVEAMGQDATCRLGGCGADAAPKASGSGCVACRIDCANRAGGTGQIYLEHATLADTCICESQPGWFWDDGAPGGGDLRPCDGDSDGWVRITAKKAMENSADVALQVNARCTVRTIDAYVLENDRGEQRSVAVDPPLRLFEPERNDDQGLLDDAVRQGTLPTYGGRALKAEELNALTKACVWKSTAQERADFNDNNFEDVDEGHEDPAQINPNNPLAPFANFSYFIETHRAWWVAPSVTPYGQIHIREKLRGSALADGFELPLAPDPADGGALWQTCDRRRDSAYLPGKPGFDFAKYSDGAWGGMNHHSQFRCLRLVTQSSGRPNEVTPDEARAAWTLSRCTPGATNPPAAPGQNPSDPAEQCGVVSAIPDPRTSTTAPVLWGIAKYLPYDDLFTTDYPLSNYSRGCVNECAEYPDRCPGFDPDPARNTSQCVGNLRNFGHLECGCGSGFAGPGCGLSCGGNLSRRTDGAGDLFLAPDFEPAPRRGTWLCARVSVSTEQVFSAHAATGTSSYTLYGEAPSHLSPVNRLCEDGQGCANGYRLSAEPLGSPIR